MAIIIIVMFPRSLDLRPLLPLGMQLLWRVSRSSSLKPGPQTSAPHAKIIRGFQKYC